jgi:hypothetical protein
MVSTVGRHVPKDLSKLLQNDRFQKRDIAYVSPRKGRARAGAVLLTDVDYNIRINVILETIRRVVFLNLLSARKFFLK